MAYLFNDKIYKDWDSVAMAVYEAFPGYHKDHYLDLIDENVEEVDDEPEPVKCWICGQLLDGLTVPFLAEKKVCSWFCLEDAGYDYS